MCIPFYFPAPEEAIEEENPTEAPSSKSVGILAIVLYAILVVSIVLLDCIAFIT